MVVIININYPCSCTVAQCHTCCTFCIILSCYTKSATSVRRRFNEFSPSIDTNALEYLNVKYLLKAHRLENVIENETANLLVRTVKKTKTERFEKMTSSHRMTCISFVSSVCRFSAVNCIF